MNPKDLKDVKDHKDFSTAILDKKKAPNKLMVFIFLGQNLFFFRLKMH